jgi:hypothetical protein
MANGWVYIVLPMSLDRVLSANGVSTALRKRNKKRKRSEN